MSVRHLFVICFAALYLALFLPLASKSSFWYDELFTYYIATQPSPADIIHELRMWADHQPPPFYLVSRWTGQLVQPAELGFRLPGMIGFLVLCICMYYFVERRTTPLYGAIAMLLPLGSSQIFAVSDARPYGAAVGCCAVAVLCWQRAAEGSRRRITLPGIAVGIAAAISMSYFSVLLLLPLVCAELWRLRERRRPDWGIMAAILAGSSISFAYIPFVSGGLSVLPPWRPSLDTPVLISLDLFGELVVVWLLILLLSAAAILFPAASGGPDEDGKAFPGHELVLGGALLLLPIPGTAVGYLVKVLFPRYVISTVLGFAILVTSQCYRLGRGFRPAGWVTLMVLLLWTSLNYRQHRREMARSGSGVAVIEQLISYADTKGLRDLPVAMDDAMRLFEAVHYADPEMSSRLVYPADPDASEKYTGFRAPEYGLVRMQQYSEVRLPPLADFRRQHPRYLLFSGGRSGYHVDMLAKDGARLQVISKRGALVLYLVEEASQ